MEKFFFLGPYFVVEFLPISMMTMKMVAEIFVCLTTCFTFKIVAEFLLLLLVHNLSHTYTHTQVQCEIFFLFVKFPKPKDQICSINNNMTDVWQSHREFFFFEFYYDHVKFHVFVCVSWMFPEKSDSFFMTFVHFARAKKNNTSFYEKIDVIKMSQLLKILRLIPCCCCCCCFFSFFPHSLRIFCMNGSWMGKKVRLSDENFFREHSRGSLSLSHIKPWILFSVQEGFISRAKKKEVCVCMCMCMKDANV